MNHIMLDIETLSRKLGAVVLSIGAVVFDPDSDRIGETFSIRLPAQEHVEMETVLVNYGGLSVRYMRLN
jgi:hypothetical protein